MLNLIEELQNSSGYRVAHAKIRAAVGDAQEKLRALAPSNSLLKLMVVAKDHMEFCPGFCEVAGGIARRPEQDGMYLAVARYVQLLNEQTDALRQSG